MIPKIDILKLKETFYDLVKISSPSGQEAEIAMYIEKRLKKMGLKPIFDNSKDKTKSNTNNLYVSIQGSARYKPILFAVHMDTVQPCMGVEPYEKEGWIMSKSNTILGADDKIGIAVLLELINYLKKNSIVHRPFEILFTVREEDGMHGAKNISLDLFKVKSKDIVCIDGSLPVNSLILASPSMTKLTFEVTGKSAHAGSNIAEGINAIEICSKCICEFQGGQLTADTTMNIGKISGGLATNVVPEHVKVEIEIRSFSSTEGKIFINKLIRLWQETIAREGGGFSYKLEQCWPAFQTEPNNPLVQLVKESIETAGLNVEYVRSGGGFEANIFKAMGFNSVVLSTGRENVHSTRERISIESMQKLSQIVYYLVTI